MTDSKLEAARRTGSLTNVIAALREEQENAQQSTATSGLEEVGLEDAAIRVAAGIATGKKDAERRTIFRDLQPGVTVTAKGVARTQLSRAEKIARVKTWATSLTEEQRTEFLIGEKFNALPDGAAEIVSEIFATLEDREYEDSIGIDNSDLDAPLIDIDQLPEDETEEPGDSFEVQAGEDVESFNIDDAGWPGDAV
jgi:hypothetical protein